MEWSSIFNLGWKWGPPLVDPYIWFDVIVAVVFDILIVLKAGSLVLLRVILSVQI